MITVSIVSHNHGSMLEELVAQLLNYPEIEHVIITLNIPEVIKLPQDSRIAIINNTKPKGFGANHNHAFLFCRTTYFCVLNPDIIFLKNPFPVLLGAFINDSIGVIGPMIKNSIGGIEDSARFFPAPLKLVSRYFLRHKVEYKYSEGSEDFFCEWIAGMFMLMRSSIYQKLNGFDERFYLYVEDADICTRAWNLGSKVILCSRVEVIHLARRASHRNLRHLAWHLNSLMRYYAKHLFHLPRISGVRNVIGK